MMISEIIKFHITINGCANNTHMLCNYIMLLYLQILVPFFPDAPLDKSTSSLEGESPRSGELLPVILLLVTIIIIKYQIYIIQFR